jgi:hypothetical protein
MASQNPTLVELATQISSNVATLVQELRKKSLPEPSFIANNGLQDYPPDLQIQGPRLALAQAALDLYHLALGPSEFLKTQTLTLKHDQMVIDVLNQFNVWDAVPLKGSASYSEIATKTNLPESICRRFLRHAMTSRIFDETTPGSGKVIHTAASAFAHKNSPARSLMGHQIEEVGYGCTSMVETIRKFGDGDGHPGTSALATRFYPDKGKEATAFEWIEKDGEGDEKGWRMRRFGQAMNYAASDPSWDIIHINYGFDWDSLGNAIVVDVRADPENGNDFNTNMI